MPILFSASKAAASLGMMRKIENMDTSTSGLRHFQFQESFQVCPLPYYMSTPKSLSHLFTLKFQREWDEKTFPIRDSRLTMVAIILKLQHQPLLF